MLSFHKSILRVFLKNLGIILLTPFSDLEKIPSTLNCCRDFFIKVGVLRNIYMNDDIREEILWKYLLKLEKVFVGL